MHANVLIVEDEKVLADMLRYNLEAEGYKVDIIGDGEEADWRIRENIPDIVLLDWMLPGISGIELCRRIRSRTQTKNLPIIMLTARGEETERVRGLATGADDYIVKPFSVPELLARIGSTLRRANPESISSLLTVDEIEFDRDTFKVTRNARNIKLGPTETRLLEFFMKHPDRVFSRAQILDGVWGRDKEVEERSVDAHVARLRAAITRGKETNPIRTVRGVGYSMR